MDFQVIALLDSPKDEFNWAVMEIFRWEEAQATIKPRRRPLSDIESYS